MVPFAVSQVGGYTEVYKGDLTFATVRDAGHQVPSFQPARGLSLIKHFLGGIPLPNTKRSN
jgi:serine carboxypeptidase-like clade 2